MKQPWLTGPRVLISIGALAVCVHALLNTLFPQAGFAISYPFWILETLAAALLCLRRALRSPHSVRIHWFLAAAGIFCTSVAAASEAPAEIFFKAVPNAATLGDFFFFSAFVPLLLALALPEDGLFAQSSFLLDCIQAAACAYLAFAVLFNILPFTGGPQQPMDYARLEHIYDAEYITLAVLAAARLLLGVRGAAERWYFRSITLYIWLYAITSGIYNHFVGKYSLTNAMDALNDVPAIALAIAAVLAPATASPSRADNRPTVIRLLDNARPILLSLTVITLSALLGRRHFAVAIGFIFGVFVLYGLRAALFQSKIQSAHAALERASGQLAEIALLDGLTGIPNRRSFDQRLAAEWARAGRNGRHLSLVLIDVDHFKQINDTYGHLAGDECLKHIVRVLRSALDRPADLLARYGGEEFAVLLPETDAPGAFLAASNIHKAMASQNTATAGAICPITVSLGVSTWDPQENSSPEQLLSAADRALYQAKQNGRNRIEFLDLQPLTAN